jgi:mevalonate kinase
MPAYAASAPGKIILFGEHAVVYGQPAIAVPVNDVRAKATIMANIHGLAGNIHINAPEIGLDDLLENLPTEDPLTAAINGVSALLGISQLPPCSIKVTSNIPVAAGLGSGAAVSVAIIRALSAFLGQILDDEQVSALAYEVEKVHHGTPSGIDNTVITYGQPVYYIKNVTTQIFNIAKPFTIVIGNTGISSPTGAAVGDVRRAWQGNPSLFEGLFNAAGDIAKEAKVAIENGNPEALGRLMDRNHELLQEMGVSSTELDRLVKAARDAGALGAKLSGAGRGGNMIALARDKENQTIAQALRESGAIGTITAEIGSTRTVESTN